MHSYHLLDQIFNQLLWKYFCPRGSFVDLIFRMVAFHQSLLGCDDYPNMIDLIKEDRIRFCKDEDGKFYRLMKLMMLSDTMSYRFIMDDDNSAAVFRE